MSQAKSQKSYFAIRVSHKHPNKPRHEKTCLCVIDGTHTQDCYMYRKEVLKNN